MSDPGRLDSTGRTPGRPRSARADRAILEAALSAFVEEGYEGMSMEGIAARAGVGKTTVYRRWPCKQDVLLAAIEGLFEEFGPQDSGSLRDDLTAVVRQARHFLAETQAGEVLPRMVVEVASGSPLGRAYMERILAPRLQAIRRVIEAGRERGETRPDLDVDLAVAAVVGPLIFLRISQTLGDPDDDLPERLVRQLVEGQTAGKR